MARRKKLNKRVAVLLGALGAVLVALLLTVAIRGRGASLLNRLFPKDPAATLRQAQEAARASNYVAADKAYLEAINAARAGSAAVETYYYEYARFNHDWALAGTGLTRTQRGERLHASVASLRKALNRNPRYVEAQDFLCRILWDAAASSQGRGWNDFIKEADVLLKLNPDDAQTYFRRGLAKAALSTPETPGQMAREALEDMEKAIELKKDEVAYWLGVIHFLEQLPGRQQQAEDTFRRAVETVPNDARLLIAYAGYLRGQKKNDEAQQRLEEAVRRDGLLGNLAMSDHYAALGQLDDAMAALANARQLDRSDARSYVREARILARQNKPRQAVEVLRQGLAIAESAATTLPAGPERRAQAQNQIDLHYLRADLLLDMIEAGSAEDRDRLLQEARQSAKSMTDLGMQGPRRAQVAGRVALAEGRIAEAVEELETAFHGSPGFDLTAANLLINVYLAQNLPGKADAILDRLLSIPGQQTNVSALMAKARLLMRYRDYERADGFVSRVLQLAPDHPEALNAKTVILAVRGEAPTLPSGVPPTPETLRMLLDRAAVLWLDNRRDEAVRYVEQLRQRAPKDPAVITRLFAMYRAVGRLGDAEKLMDEAIDYYPDDKSLKARRALVRETDPQKQYEILMAVAEEYPPLQRALEKANVALTFGKEDDHLTYLREASRIDPNAPGVVERLFRHAVLKKDWKLAEDCVARARKGNVDGSEGRTYQARLAEAREDHDGAIAAAMEALKASPNRKDARVLLGQAYLRKRMYDQAHEAFKTVADNDPGYTPALIGLAAVTQAQGKQDEHRAWVRAAYRLVPDDGYIRARHFEIERENASPEELIREREMVLRRSPDDLGNLAALAMLYERVNRPKDAEDAYLDLHEKSSEKLYSARLLCGFYLRAGRLAEVEKVIGPMLESAQDRVGVRVLYGEVLTPIDQAKAKSLFEQAITADVKDPRGHLGLARYHAALSDWSQAVAAMTTYVRLRPEDIGGAKELIRYAIDAGEFDNASNRLDEILRANPADATAVTLKGVLALRQGQVGPALQLFGQAIQDNPTYAEPLIYRAQVHLAKGDPTKAKADLQDAKRLSNRVDVAMQLALVYMGLQDLENAELVLREIYGERRNYSPAVDQLIAIYFRRQKWHELEQLLAEAKSTFPRSPGYLLAEAEMWRLRDEQAKRQSALAQAVQLAPNAPMPLRAYLAALQEAKEYDKLLEASWSHMDNPNVAPWVAAYRAAALAKLNRHEEAEHLFVTALDKAEPAYVLVLVHQVQEAYGLTMGVEKFTGWVRQQPDNWRLQLVLGVLYAEAEKLTEAVQCLEKARDLAKEPLARYLADRHLGATSYRLGKFQDTEKYYLACIQFRANDVEVLNNLAYLYAENLNQPKKALPFASQAAAGLPNNAKVLDTYGWTLAKLERHTDAEQVLLRAVQLENALAASRYHLGWVYERLGRLDEAMKQYRQGFEMVRTSQDDPLYKQLQEAIERVRQALESGSGR